MFSYLRSAVRPPHSSTTPSNPDHITLNSSSNAGEDHSNDHITTGSGRPSLKPSSAVLSSSSGLDLGSILIQPSSLGPPISDIRGTGSDSGTKGAVSNLNGNKKGNGSGIKNKLHKVPSPRSGHGHTIEGGAKKDGSLIDSKLSATTTPKPSSTAEKASSSTPELTATSNTNSSFGKAATMLRSPLALSSPLLSDNSSLEPAIGTAPSSSPIIPSNPNFQSPSIASILSPDSDNPDRRNGLTKRLRIFDRLRIRRQSLNLRGSGSTTNFSTYTSSSNSSGLTGSASTTTLSSAVAVTVAPTMASTSRSASLDDDLDPRIIGPPRVRDFSGPRHNLPFVAPRSVNFDQPRQHFSPVMVPTAPSRTSGPGFIGGRRAFLAESGGSSFHSSRRHSSVISDHQSKRGTLQETSTFIETIPEMTTLDVTSPLVPHQSSPGPDSGPEMINKSQSRPHSFSAGSTRRRASNRSKTLSHSDSKSSQFSFQLMNGSVQERILEERHRLKQAREAPDEEDDDFWRQDMSDYGDYDDEYGDGFEEEPIPMADEGDHDDTVSHPANRLANYTLPGIQPEQLLEPSISLSSSGVRDPSLAPSTSTASVVTDPQNIDPGESLGSLGHLDQGSDGDDDEFSIPTTKENSPSPDTYPTTPTQIIPSISIISNPKSETESVRPPSAPHDIPMPPQKPKDRELHSDDQPPSPPLPHTADDDLYFDDGLIASMLPEDPMPDCSMLSPEAAPPFDESIFDTDDEKEAPRRKPSVRPNFSQRRLLKNGSINQASAQPPPRSGGQLNQFHDLITSALMKAELDGRFEREEEDLKKEASADSPKLSVPVLEEPPSTAPKLTMEEIPDSDADDNDLGDFNFDDDDDDDGIIAAANADVLDNDTDGFYGHEFGFYSRSVGSYGQEGLGGYFGPPGLQLTDRRSVREPNLTPITERSEYSARNSYVSPALTSNALSAGMNITPAYLRHHSVVGSSDIETDGKRDQSSGGQERSGDDNGSDNLGNSSNSARSSRDLGSQTVAGGTSPCPIPAKNRTSSLQSSDGLSVSLSSISSFSPGSRPVSQELRPFLHRHHPRPSSTNIPALESLAEDRENEDQSSDSVAVHDDDASDSLKETPVITVLGGEEGTKEGLTPSHPSSVAPLPEHTNQDGVVSQIAEDGKGSTAIPPSTLASFVLTAMLQLPSLTRPKSAMDISDSESLSTPDIPKRSSLRLRNHPRPASDIQHNPLNGEGPDQTTDTTAWLQQITTSSLGSGAISRLATSLGPASDISRPDDSPTPFIQLTESPQLIKTTMIQHIPTPAENQHASPSAHSHHTASLPSSPMSFQDFLKTAPTGSATHSAPSTAAPTPTRATHPVGVDSLSLRVTTEYSTPPASASTSGHALAPFSLPSQKDAPPSDNRDVDLDAAYVRQNRVPLPQLQMKFATGPVGRQPTTPTATPASPHTPQRQRISYHGDRAFISSNRPPSRPSSGCELYSSVDSLQHIPHKGGVLTESPRPVSLPVTIRSTPIQVQIPVPPPNFSTIPTPMSVHSQTFSVPHQQQRSPPVSFSKYTQTPVQMSASPSSTHTPHRLSRMVFPPVSPPPAMHDLHGIIPSDPEEGDILSASATLTAVQAFHDSSYSTPPRRYRDSGESQHQQYQNYRNSHPYSRMYDEEYGLSSSAVTVDTGLPPPKFDPISGLGLHDQSSVGLNSNLNSERLSFYRQQGHMGMIEQGDRTG